MQSGDPERRWDKLRTQIKLIFKYDKMIFINKTSSGRENYSSISKLYIKYFNGKNGLENCNWRDRPMPDTRPGSLSNLIGTHKHCH